MSNHTFQISPFNLDKFKSKAKRFSSLITKISGYDKLKSKERYNLLAQGLGYKDHGALVRLSLLRNIPKNNGFFNIFVYQEYRQRIINTVISNHPSIAKKHIEKAIEEMIVDERLEIFNMIICTPRSRESFLRTCNNRKKRYQEVIINQDELDWTQL